MRLGEFFTLLGYLTGALIFYLAARGKKLATEGMGYVALAGLCGGVIGARIGALLSTPGAALTFPGGNGKALLGGLFGGWLAVELCKKQLGLTRSTGDLWALALPAGEAVGRIGCYLNGCCYGSVCTAPWAVYQQGAWRHPAQLYASFIAALIFVALLSLRTKLSREGDLFRAWMLLFAAGRFVLEFYRERPSLFFGLSLAQWLCLEIFVSGALWWLWMSHRKIKMQEA
jgi:phosphatidylglycerol:prolipoprotein diacylglycerol transferase